jgi:hypothetical protein
LFTTRQNMEAKVKTLIPTRRALIAPRLSVFSRNSRHPKRSRQYADDANAMTAASSPGSIRGTVQLALRLPFGPPPLPP